MPKLPAISGVTKISDENFEKFAKESQKPVMVIAGARWCADTKRMFTLVLPDFVKRNKNKIKFGSVEIEDDNKKVLNKRIKNYFKIKNFPTVIFYKKGKLRSWKLSDGKEKEQKKDLEFIANN
jgi:thioredoxin-like negative regulator of GroEL